MSTNIEFKLCVFDVYLNRITLYVSFHQQFLVCFIQFLVSYFWLCWVLAATWALPSCGSRGYSPGAACGLLTAVLLERQSPGSRAQAQWSWRTGLLLCCVWDLPGSEIKPVSPALAADFLLLKQQGSPPPIVFIKKNYN